MAGQMIDTAPDSATVERLSVALNRCFETCEVPDDVVAPDVFCDLLPPLWRFQLEGREAFGEQLRANSHGNPVTARILRVQPTAGGFVMEHEETQHGDEVEVARRLLLCEVRDGLVSEVLVYCNGGWDAALRARHAAEAPMLRP